MNDDILSCSFCSKNQHEVSKLIRAAEASICNECVDLCSGILTEEGHTPTEKEPGAQLVPGYVKLSSAMLSQFAKLVRDEHAEEDVTVMLFWKENTVQMAILGDDEMGQAVEGPSGGGA